MQVQSSSRRCKVSQTDEPDDVAVYKYIEAKIKNLDDNSYTDLYVHQLSSRLLKDSKPYIMHLLVQIIQPFPFDNKLSIERKEYLKKKIEEYWTKRYGVKVRQRQRVEKEYSPLIKLVIEKLKQSSSHDGVKRPQYELFQEAFQELRDTWPPHLRVIWPLTVRQQLQKLEEEEIILHQRIEDGKRKLEEIIALGKEKNLTDIDSSMIPSIYQFLNQGLSIVYKFLQQIDHDKLILQYERTRGEQYARLHNSMEGNHANHATFINNLLNAVANVELLYEYAVVDGNLDEKLVSLLRAGGGCLDGMLFDIPGLIDLHKKAKKNPFNQLTQYIEKEKEFQFFKTNDDLKPQNLQKQQNRLHKQKFLQAYEKLRGETQKYRNLIDERINWQGTFHDFLNSIIAYFEDYERAGKTILVLQSTYDPNHAFDEDGDVGLLRQLQLIGNPIFRTVSSLNDIKRELDQILDNSIIHLIIMAHGSDCGKQIVLGLGEENVISKRDRGIGILAEMLRPKLHPGATILLHSCSMGRGGTRTDNFAGTLSKLLQGHKIYAAEEPIQRGDLLLSRLQIAQNGNVISQYAIDQQRFKDDKRTPYNIVEFLTPSKRITKQQLRAFFRDPDAPRSLKPFQQLLSFDTNVSLVKNITKSLIQLLKSDRELTSIIADYKIARETEDTGKSRIFSSSRAILHSNAARQLFQGSISTKDVLDFLENSDNESNIAKLVPDGDMKFFGHKIYKPLHDVLTEHPKLIKVILDIKPGHRYDDRRSKILQQMLIQLLTSDNIPEMIDEELFVIVITSPIFDTDLKKNAARVFIKSLENKKLKKSKMMDVLLHKLQASST